MSPNVLHFKMYASLSNELRGYGFCHPCLKTVKCLFLANQIPFVRHPEYKSIILGLFQTNLPAGHPVHQSWTRSHHPWN